MVTTLVTSAVFADEIPQQSQTAVGQNVLPLKTVLVKFLVAMGGVGIALAVLWFGLIFYKKILNKDFCLSLNSNKKDYKHRFSTPKTVEDATISFIKRNRL